ncbi:MAG: Glu/Leu/Phe/Val dehydrogenase [Nanoarchaeota archaeon]
MVEFDEFGPEKILEVYDHKTGMHGFTVIDNTNRGPGKGGIRMTPTVSIDEVARLARAMTWKNAIAALPFGGAKSGIIATQDQINDTKKKHEIIAAFSKAIKSICPSKYIAGPDINTTEKDMEVFAKANGSLRSATGKPVNLCVKSGVKCGIPHEFGSTGFGVYHATLIAAEHYGMNIIGTSVAIEGFGNVGTFTAEYLSMKKAKIVAVSDSKGTIYNENGLDYKKLMQVKNKTGSVINYKPGKILGSKIIHELDVDILIPGALPDVINQDNVDKVKAKIIVEAANIPIKTEFEERLHNKGILIVPDIVANAGGVISSYAEYRGFNPKKMFEIVEKKIIKNTRIVLDRAKKDGTTTRDAALAIAMERVKAKMK